MSHWGATVITNLLSAIPFIGNDIVPLFVILPLYFYFIFYFIYNIFIFLLIKNNKSLSLYKNEINSSIINKLPGLIPGDLSSFQEDKLESSSIKEDYKNKNFIDRNLLELIVGFIDGDGYFRVTKKLKKENNIIYIYISLIINLNKNELELLQYFQKHLNIGKVNYITPKKGNKLVRWEINKSDIFNILEPLLNNYNIKFLTEKRQEQFLLIKYIKNNNLYLWNDLHSRKVNINKYIKNNKIENNFNKLDYFNNWLVGFTMAEGSFLVKRNKDICFQLKQKYNFNLFNDISKLFNITRKLDINKNKYIQFSVSSIKDIQNIINFFSFSNNHPLLGNKLISYNKWLLSIKKSSRYKNCIIK